MKIKEITFLVVYIIITILSLTSCETGTETNDSISDTTSQSFSWEKLTFGDYSSRLFDVAIIDENNIWAVGEIHTDETGKFDSNGVWVQPYNAVHWDGNTWELKRIADSGYPRNVVYAFGENNVWFDGTIHWDGVKYSVHRNGFPLLPNGDGWRINSMWGSSSDNLYIVGNDGNIAHYNGREWIKIKSKTELNINDIYGSYNSSNDTFEIIAVASNELEGYEKAIIKIIGSEVTSLSNTPIKEVLSSVWFLPNEIYYVAGSGIYQKNNLGNQSWKNNPLDITKYYIYKIRGNSANDVVGVGGFGEIIHFNGKRWHSFFDETSINGNYSSVDIKDNIIVAVGQDQPFGVIAIGKR